MATLVQEEAGQRDEQQVELEEESWMDIAKLQDVGINASDIAKLKIAGMHTVTAVIQQTSKKLQEIKGMSESKCNQIYAAAKKLENYHFKTGTELQHARSKIVRVSTGSSSFDQMLGGGLESQSITECFGEFRTGKTQLAHTLCVTAQLPSEMGGGNGRVLFIDTEGTFRPERIVDIAARYNVDASQVLDNITVARAYTSEHQLELLCMAAGLMVEHHYSLIIVDSITALFRVDYTGRGQLADRQQKLGQFASMLTKLAEEFNVGVYITNQVVSDPGAGASAFVSDPKKPIGGHILAHASTTRLYLRKGRADQRICKIYDSPCLPESECVFQLSVGGICDVKD